ncbi:MAG: site-2 protease family protein [Chloroflexi bacterium]|nr:MAG: site-2 protease family protein [Chloroflexota bacterium]MBL1194987.1 site-2 protease family protein [Chloroflexota bacterium]NOH12275.1 site-2 protease family protein [Chloroflexota bacterium]
MSWSIRLFKVKGIDVQVHLTFLLILVWAAFRWSGTTGAGWTGALFGVVATLLLFASVTLHEIGHSLLALKFNVPVKDITLLPVGGLARIEKMPEKPSEEFRIAIAGPLVNFAIALSLIGLGVVLDLRAVISISDLYQAMGQVSWSGMLAYLTMANVALGIFNLIPAYPMDGGRVLRALLASLLGYVNATRIAVRIGQALAFAVGLWGFMSGSYSLILIAIFVWIGAGQEGRQVEAKEVLDDMTVRQVMTLSPHTLRPQDRLSNAVELILSTMQSDFPVVDQDGLRVLGMLTEEDLLKGLKSYGASSLVSDSMRNVYSSAGPDEPLFGVQEQMGAKRVKSFPILDGEDQLLGLLTSQDINEAYKLFSTFPKLAHAIS